MEVSCRCGGRPCFERAIAIDWWQCGKQRWIGIAVAIVVGRDRDDRDGQRVAGWRGVAGEVDDFDIKRDLAVGQRERQLD